MFSAKEFHLISKQSVQSVRNSSHTLDWQNYPFPFKIYHNLTSLPLPDTFPDPMVSALTAVSSINPQPKTSFIDINTLAEL